MKYIHKQPEPKEFLDWKSKDKMYLRGKPNWTRVPTNVKDIIRESLKNEQGFICCYCEREIKENDYHMEHIKPKGMNMYNQSQLDYDNLLCSCQLELVRAEPRHCGNSKGSWYKENLFLSPLDPDCEGKFKFYANGQIGSLNEKDDATMETISHLNLDIDKLNALRNKVIEPFLNLDEALTEMELKEWVSSYLVAKENNGGKFNEFYTTIRFLFT